MVAQYINLLFAWMPFPLYIICTGVVALFFLMTALHLVRFILDLIPFL